MRPIDADTISTILTRIIEEQKKSHHDDEVIGLMEARTEVNNAPTLDVKPVVHAHRIPYESETGEGSNTYKCSSCGGVQEIIYRTPKENRWNYRPSCGAKMNEEET
jgi:hypothetical protein